MKTNASHPLPKATRQDVAAALNISLRTVDDLTAKGRLPFYRIGRAVRFDLAEVESYLRRTAYVAAQTRVGFATA